MRVIELESRLNGVHNQPTPYTTPASLTASDNLAAAPAYTPPQDIPWQSIQNRFPAIAFLDSDTFKYGGIAVPKPAVEIPVDALELLGDGSAVQAVITDYYATVHKWIPIVSQKRLTRNMANPLWEAGPDLALLFLCMKLITSRPQDGIESSHNPIYISAKRFVTLMEASGTASLLVLQANLLVTWFEYGQAIYPAAWMSAGWCVRYANMLGINGHNDATQLLGRPGTWTELEERRRTWWGVLLADRIVSIGSQGYILNSQEPKKDDFLPVSDSAWDGGETSAVIQRRVDTPVDEAMDPFPRLCQASVMLGKVLSHHQEKIPSETATFGLASQLYLDISTLTRKVSEEAASSKDYIDVITPLALTFSSLSCLCERYSCSSSCSAATAEASAMQAQAIDGLKTVSDSIFDFAEKLSAAAPLPQDLDKISPIIMDALYSAASNYAWWVRESGDQRSQMALDSIRHFLRRLGSRWRNAAEYLRILEAREFTYAVGSAGTS